MTAAILEDVAAQAPARRRNEPRVTMLGADPSSMAGFGEIRAVSGGTVTLAELGAREAYLNTEAADELGAAAGDRIVVLAGGRPSRLVVRDVVSYDGGGTAESGSAHPAPDRPGDRRRPGARQPGAGLQPRRRHLRRGALRPGARARAARRRAGWASRRPTPSARRSTPPTRPAAPSCRSSPPSARFSIAAGVLLIFLIFVMLAAERRSELGIARAVGTRRGHLVQMFLFEGAAYDLAAALVGAVLGAGVAYADGGGR